MKVKTLFALVIIVLFIGVSFLPVCSSIKATVKEKMNNEESTDGFEFMEGRTYIWGYTKDGDSAVNGALVKLRPQWQLGDGLKYIDYNLQCTSYHDQKYGKAFYVLDLTSLEDKWPFERDVVLKGIAPFYEPDTQIFPINQGEKNRMDLDLFWIGFISKSTEKQLSLYNILQANFPFLSVLLNRCC